MKNLTESIMLVLVCSVIAGIFTLVLVEAIDRTCKIADAQIGRHLQQMPSDVRRAVTGH